MSVYDLRDHQEYKFRPGTIVIRIGNILPEESAAGQVVDNYPDGQVSVHLSHSLPLALLLASEARFLIDRCVFGGQLQALRPLAGLRKFTV